MPHINRVRVNNVKYNFGTQFYDDFMMRFSCKNTIYDLANGGGKSVLMLLLLQNLIPNCTLDEKQPVEKLFRTSSGSNTIHSLIEWKLDACYQRDNYKYMTTGFCARKAKDGDEGEKESANIEYFNYCIFYREFGDNDIKNLPLSKDGERITYNGLKGYLRDLEKKDRSVEVCIFERKGDYQSFISQYGLFESEWEIIRGINKTEGHVRTYFENNYKTGRKVVEDLLIEEIIQKSFNNQIGNIQDEEGMAKTLLDIKDKIIELSRRRDEISVFDKQIGLMQQLTGRIKAFSDYQEEKEGLKNSLLNKLAICKRLLKDIQQEQDESDAAGEELLSRYNEEDRLISIARILDDENELKKLSALVDECQAHIDELNIEKKDLADKINLIESYEAWDEMKKYQALKDQVVLAMDSSMRDNGDVMEEIHSLCGKARELTDKITAKLTLDIEDGISRVTELENEYNRVDALQKEADITQAVTGNKIENLERDIAQKEEKIKGLLNDTGILMAENASEELENSKNKSIELEAVKSSLSYEVDKLSGEIESINENISEAKVNLKLFNEKEKNYKTKTNSNKSNANIEDLYSIYGETNLGRLANTVYSMYKNSIKRAADLEMKINSKNEYVGNLTNGRYVFDGRQYREVEEYLFNTYGDDVMYGYQWFATLSALQQRDIKKRVPFIDYSFVILGDFERVKEDADMHNFTHCSYIVPVISEMIVRDMRHAASADYMVFGTKDLSFLMDATKVEAEIEDVRNEINEAEQELKSQKYKQDILLKDYLFVLDSMEENKNLEGVESLESIRKSQADATALIETCQNQIEELIETRKEIRGKLISCEESIKSEEEKQKNCVFIDELNQDITKLYNELKSYNEELVKSKALAKEYLAAVRNYYEKWQQAKESLRTRREELKEVSLRWQNIFLPYYSETFTALQEDLNIEEAAVRFNGLIGALNSENSDVSDKQSLIKTYEDNIARALKDIKRRGYTLEAVREAADKTKELIEGGSYDRFVSRVDAIAKELSVLNQESDAQNAQKNRMEGSLFHARTAIEEKYGAFELFECNNTAQFIAEHKNSMKAIKESMTELDKKRKSNQGQISELTVIDKDIERMVKSSGVNIPQNIIAAYDVSIKDLEGYEDIQKQYDKLLRNEYTRREEFMKEKRRIIDELRANDAYDLADEVELSVNVPEDMEEINQMSENIDQTCQCILLERDRVGKGIDDMEKIKDSFENRCIQTCCNIKAELDRLPKLSKITLDNEVISMIGLSIPYVKEEFYKERMSAYINDTVAFSESFKTNEERISYIRSRLSWKKLFSVIVTDMNGIRLNLYKRERIKDQSRYLRYEEAVGSTGQSQGIYIQFLVAIINYISNINAAGKEVSAIGKVVFIDNPFGAAKDVYIWEPIFKLLKTNHVQLIVPARGATPAITGRFDVNYILGQKMVNKRQQTVVVDYRSQIQNEEMEYSRLEYSQESLF